MSTHAFIFGALRSTAFSDNCTHLGGCRCVLHCGSQPSILRVSHYHHFALLEVLHSLTSFAPYFCRSCSDHVPFAMVGYRVGCIAEAGPYSPSGLNKCTPSTARLVSIYFVYVLAINLIRVANSCHMWTSSSLSPSTSKPATFTITETRTTYTQLPLIPQSRVEIILSRFPDTIVSTTPRSGSSRSLESHFVLRCRWLEVAPAL
jgi:hypothetical protein